MLFVVVVLTAVCVAAIIAGAMMLPPEDMPVATGTEVLGVVLLNTQYTFGFVQSVVYGVFGGLGFMLAICLFASVREKLEFADYPECFEGFPICLVSAGLLALAFMGFSGMKIG